MMRARTASHSHADLIGNLVRRHGAELPITEVVRNFAEPLPEQLRA